MRACKSMYFNTLEEIGKYFQPVILAQKREAVAALDLKAFDGITVAVKLPITKLN